MEVQHPVKELQDSSTRFRQAVLRLNKEIFYFLDAHHDTFCQENDTATLLGVAYTVCCVLPVGVAAAPKVVVVCPSLPT